MLFGRSQVSDYGSASYKSCNVLLYTLETYETIRVGEQSLEMLLLAVNIHTTLRIQALLLSIVFV